MPLGLMYDKFQCDIRNQRARNYITVNLTQIFWKALQLPFKLNNQVPVLPGGHGTNLVGRLLTTQLTSPEASRFLMKRFPFC